MDIVRTGVAQAFRPAMSVVGRAFRPAVLAAIAVVGVVAAQDPAPNKGEEIQNAACLGCHDLRPIETAAENKDGWNQLVSSMINKGAEVSDADKPVLVDFLVKNHGPLPEGPGKNILLNTCTICHDLGRVRAHTVSRDEWQETLEAMLNEGAMLSDQDFPVLLNYLARTFK